MKQFVSPDDEHCVLETCRELYENRNKHIEENLCITLVIHQEKANEFHTVKNDAHYIFPQTCTHQAVTAFSLGPNSVL